MECRYINRPINIGKMTLKNRVVMTALQTNYAEAGADGGYVNQRVKDFYFRRAEGGAALLIVGGTATDKYVGYKNMLRIDDDRYIQGFRELADGIHQRGSRICVQLLQTGRYGSAEAVFCDNEVLSASAVPCRFSGENPREMTKEEIKAVISNAARAAARVKEAGCDAVEIVANSGYMISQFLSPFTNKRTDEYGGSFEKRCRFGLEMIEAIREAVGEDFPVILRVAGNEFIRDGNGMEECAAFCKKAEAAGIDAVNVTGGWHETKIPQLPADVPRGAFTYLAQNVKKAVSVPVISSNRHNTPEEAEKVIATGQADIVGEMRTLIADPDWVNKVIENRAHEIRKCLACNQGCFAKVFSDRACQCLFNSYVGRDGEESFDKVEKPKRILVVGAGPAGCEFAYRAASRGHKVTIWEKASVIGGKALVASLPPEKYEFGNIPQFYEAMLKKYDVEVCLGREATADEIAAGGFDEVVTCCGSEAKTIKLEGAEDIMVCGAEDILKGKVVAGRNVLVIGGGSVGCETANYMTREASLDMNQLYFMMTQEAESIETITELVNTCNRKITVVDMEKTAANYDYGCAWPILKELRRFGVDLLSKTRVKSIDKIKVTLEKDVPGSDAAKSMTIDCDTIVLAVGYRENSGLASELIERNIKVHNLGDSLKVGKVSDAIKAADDLAAII